MQPAVTASTVQIGKLRSVHPGSTWKSARRSEPSVGSRGKQGRQAWSTGLLSRWLETTRPVQAAACIV